MCQSHLAIPIADPTLTNLVDLQAWEAPRSNRGCCRRTILLGHPWALVCGTPDARGRVPWPILRSAFAIPPPPATTTVGGCAASSCSDNNHCWAPSTSATYTSRCSWALLITSSARVTRRWARAMNNLQLHLVRHWLHLDLACAAFNTSIKGLTCGSCRPPLHNSVSASASGGPLASHRGGILSTAVFAMLGSFPEGRCGTSWRWRRCCEDALDHCTDSSGTFRARNGLRSKWRTGFTQFTLLESPDGFLWSGARLRKQLTSRSDHLWPELWKSMEKHVKLKEKQKWSNHKLHLENVRNFRKIYFIDSEDREFKKAIMKTIQSFTQYFSNKDHKLSKWQSPKTWISSPDYQVAMDKQRTHYFVTPKWKWKMLTKYSKFQNPSVQTFGFVFHDTNGLNHGPVWKTQLFLLKGICMVILWQDCSCEKIQLEHGWEKIPNWECLFVHREKKMVLICVCRWHKIGWKETKSWSDVESIQQRSRFAELTSFLDHVYLVCTQRKCETSKDVVDNYRVMIESRISTGGSKEITIPSKSSYFFMVLWHDWSCKEVWGTMLWVDKQDDATTLQSIYFMHRWPFISKKKKWNLLENCHMYALKLFRNICTSLVMEDLIGSPDILSSVNKLARSITQWTKVCDKRLNWLISFIHHDNIVMLVILSKNVDCDCFKSLTSQEILKIQNPLLEEHYVFLAVTHLFQ